MASRVLVNGVAGTQVSALDRGLAYGDGLFETVRFLRGEAPLWLRHVERLQRSCERLGLVMPDAATLLHEARTASGGMDDAVVRITVTRGVSERGYAFTSGCEHTRVVAAFPAPAANAAIWREGVRLHVCALRLAEQPRLAGMKHLNRLEQVLARAEWNDPRYADGLVMDAAGRVVSTVMANVFVVIGGEVLTPALDRCGVAGVARAEILAVRENVRVVDLPWEALPGASEIFLSSSVRGIVPVQAVGNTVYVPGPVTRDLQAHWRGLGFPMEHA